MICPETNVDCKQPDSCEARGCFAQRVKTVGVMEIRSGTTKSKKGPSQPASPSWEAGEAGEYRQGGRFMPYISPGSGSSMGIKEYSENRRKWDGIRDRQRKDPQIYN